ncbi:MAG: DoxX family membrane protein [Minisyncoccia bacterium]
MSKKILRIGLAIVFLYFGINQFQSASKWISLLPDFLANSNLAIYFIYLNAGFDVILGLCFLFEKFLKIVSILAALHLLGIAFFSLGITSSSGIRDLGLAFAALSLFFK